MTEQSNVQRLLFLERLESAVFKGSAGSTVLMPAKSLRRRDLLCAASDILQFLRASDNNVISMSKSAVASRGDRRVVEQMLVGSALHWAARTWDLSQAGVLMRAAASSSRRSS